MNHFREPWLPGLKLLKSAIRFRSFERHFIFFTLKNILGLVKFFCRQNDTIGSIWNHFDTVDFRQGRGCKFSEKNEMSLKYLK